jgi:outer membrane protein assembly factor BamB
VHNPIKGTPSFDPSFNGNLYVGQGIPREKPFGQVLLNLFSHKQTQFFPEDKAAWRGWGADDSSPVVVDKFLFWCGENGTVYKFLRDEQNLIKHSTLRYKVDGKNAPGIESSPAIYKNYGYLTDNHGNIICFNLNTLNPVWYYDNHDDTDASPVVEETDGVPFVYTGCEIDKQGTEGQSYFVKLNGLTGEKVWEQKISGKRRKDGEKWFDGGMFATPLVGIMDCDSMIFSNFCINTPAYRGEFIAFNKNTGDIIYRTILNQYAWSSPVAVCNKNNEMFIFTADTDGNIYLIQGKTGEIVLKQKIGTNFESSPIIVGNSVIMGSRGREIYKLSIE